MSNAYAAYQRGGRPALVSSAVLFLDVLGTGKSRDADEAQRYLDQTHTAFTRARSWGESRQGATDLTVAAWFSDNLAMAIPVTVENGLLPADAVSLLVMHSALHQLALASFGLFARGAITFGPFYADPDFVHGTALNDAYKLESKQAVYPRVILDEDARKKLAERPTARSEFEENDTRLMVGDDGRSFVDYLRHIEYVTHEYSHVPDELAGHRDRIRHALALENGPHEREKLLWLAAYHDNHVGNMENGTMKVGSPPWRFEMDDPDLRRA